MHELGTRFETEIVSGGAKTTVVKIDKWDFGHQVGYAAPPGTKIRRGDTVNTVCTYTNPGPRPVSYGEDTDDEMCLNFMTVYPIGALPVPDDPNYRFCGGF
jgi:hypothetical protein